MLIDILGLGQITGSYLHGLSFCSNLNPNKRGQVVSIIRLQKVGNN